MAEITMQELIENTTNANEDTAIFMIDDKYGVALTTEHSFGTKWYHLYVRTGIPGKYGIEIIRAYRDESCAVAAFKALTV